MHDFRVDSITFEIRYAYGYTYLDRCGQCLNEIEQKYPEWTCSDVNLNRGNLHNPTLHLTASFNAEKFDISSGQSISASDFAKEANRLWTIVCGNLGLSTLIRVGCRFIAVSAFDAIDSAEKYIRDSALSLPLPKPWKELELQPVGEQIALTVKRGKFDYRIAAGAATRTQSIGLSALISSDPKILSRQRREVRLAAVKERLTAEAQMSMKPTHVAMFDVDCVEYDPTTVKVVDYIETQYRFYVDKLLPVFGRLA